MCKRLTATVMLALSGLLLAVTLVVLPAGAWPAGTTYFVDPAGNNGHTCTAPGAATACQTIGGALGKAAASGDGIVVAAGTYHEHLTVGKSVTIDGTGATASSTILDGSATDRVMTVSAGMNVVLFNLTIKNGKTSGNGGGILNNGTLALNNGVVTANTGPQLESKTWAQVATWTKRCITGHWFDVTTGLIAATRAENQHTIMLKLMDIALCGRVLPHLSVHRRCHH